MFSVFEDAHTKVPIKCPIHGEFEQTPGGHLSCISGCPKCGMIKGQLNQTKTKEEFIAEANKVHGKGTYGYGKVIYVNTHTPVDIDCPVCEKPFSQEPNSHLRGQGCPKCGRKKAATSKTKTTEKFIAESNKVHGEGRYTILSEYRGCKEKMKIECLVCTLVFYQEADSHLQSHGCPRCAGCYVLTTEEFIAKANIVHKGIYGYGKVKYVNTHTPVEIECLKCKNPFHQTPANHLHARNPQGCPYCQESKLEKRLTQIFEKLGYKSHPQHRYKECKNTRQLPFDNAILEEGKVNILIEMDGVQHFEQVKHFGGVESYRKRIKHDTIKNKFCLENDKILVRISYLDIEKIETLIKQAIKNRDEGIYDIIYSDPHLYQTAYFPTWKPYVGLRTLQRKCKISYFI